MRRPCSSRRCGWSGGCVVIDPESFAILESGRKRAGELAAKATTDGQRVDGEVSVSATGGGWWAKAWAKVTARKATKPDLSAGVEVTKRW